MPIACGMDAIRYPAVVRPPNQTPPPPREQDFFRVLTWTRRTTDR